MKDSKVLYSNNLTLFLMLRIGLLTFFDTYWNIGEHGLASFTSGLLNESYEDEVMDQLRSAEEASCSQFALTQD